MNNVSITLNKDLVVGHVNRRVFGSFVEHLGRCVYDGIYEPTHPLADEEGFRTDVIELVKELGISAVRYPGGNFVSGFRWEDSVGPKEQRPRRLDLAWHSTETNEVGLHEFASWLEKVGSELMYAVNLGTRGVLEALDVLEYANTDAGSTLAQKRIENGREKPFDIRMWCLGNEMDAPWQLGFRDAEAYGVIASQTAKAMRQMDENLELVACGSSGAGMPTFGEWERIVLEHTYDDVDYISCHAYYQEHDGDIDSFLASAKNMDHFIESVINAADLVKATKRSEKTINISFDEWNVWYLTRHEAEEKITDIKQWPVAPRLLEDVYSVVDAVVFGNLMISLIRHADRVTSASLAQLVNVIAPIMTEPGGAAWRQTTFYPFSITSRLAQGKALQLAINSPTYETKLHGEAPLVDSVATFDEESGRLAVFLVNRSTTEEITVTVNTSGLALGGIEEATSIFDEDVYAKNTKEDPERVTPRVNESAKLEGDTITVTLPPVSWTAIAAR